MVSRIQPANELTSQWLWTLFILMFFSIQAVIWTVAISITATDRSHAVVSGYDEKGLIWDEIKSAQVASERLGWTVEIRPDSKPDLKGNRRLVVAIEGGDGKPLQGVVFELDVYHRAYAADKQSVELIETEPGQYCGTFQSRKPGKWVFEGQATWQHQVKLIHETHRIPETR